MFLLFREFVVAKRRNEDRNDERMVLAWTTAALIRQKKLPELQKLLSRRHRDRPQTKQEQVAVLHQISARCGIPMRKADKKRRIKRG